MMPQNACILVLFLAKLDLQEAYRSIPLHESCYEYTGLQWLFAGDSSPTYFFDARLPFGASRSCHIFQSLTDSVIRMLDKKGIRAIGYIDDYLLVCDSLEECEIALKVTVDLIESLGLSINWSKVDGSAQKLTFLGVEVNCIERTLALPAKKLCEVNELLQTWVGRKKATKKDIQKLVGKLSWCSR
jgi:hypothetical protein